MTNGRTEFPGAAIDASEPVRMDWSKCVSSRLMVLGEMPPPSVSFHGPSKEVMRITQTGVWVDPDLTTDEAAKAIIEALDVHIKHVVAAHRGALEMALEALERWSEAEDHYDRRKAYEPGESAIAAIKEILK